MTQESEEQAIEQGHACAMAALTAQKDDIAALPPGERLYWWVGFVTAAMGAALASIGEPAVRALRASLADSRDTPHVVQRRKSVSASTTLRKKRTYIRELLTHRKKKA
jgi:hypothetical protein